MMTFDQYKASVTYFLDHYPTAEEIKVIRSHFNRATSPKLCAEALKQGPHHAA